jgi:hypothetical protein
MDRTGLRISPEAFSLLSYYPIRPETVLDPIGLRHPS